MVVLVVDDQTYVVSGIVSGVQWDRLNVSRVLKAYNALEAREIMKNQVVDILLCDIEMPAEDGLSLFKWVKSSGIGAECIFLTAHADFLYAKEALKLGGFDYILQPARYEDIEDAILRAMNKIKSTKEQHEFASYGQIFYERKDRMLNNILLDLFSSNDATIDAVLEDFKKLDIHIQNESYVHVVLASVFDTGTLSPVQVWEALQNAAGKVFDGYGQMTLLSELGKGKYAYLIYSESAQLIDGEGLMRQLALLIGRMRDAHGCSLACYTGGSLTPGEIPARMAKLVNLDEDNVALSNKTFFLGQSRDLAKEPGVAHLFRRWTGMMANGGGQVAHEEICAYLEKLAGDGQLDAEGLRRFYQNFIQMIFSVAEQKHVSIQHVFRDREALDWSMNAYLTLNKMIGFINYVMACFYKTDTELEDKNQADRIIKYIVENIGEDIRREDIAKEVFLNPDYLSRLFKKEVGVSLKEYITEIKMKHARKLLKTTSMQISMIAIKVGYTNFSHFSQVYKKTMGISPIEERERRERGEELSR